ncbi:MAG: YfbM family protein [Actinomycetaceae bacterium]|nr:YfbM family protein [Actinomycetaceae bacterium]
MGLRAEYLAIPTEELQRIEAATGDLSELWEELAGNDIFPRGDIDKSWDGLHFLLTGESATDPIEDNRLSEAIVGVDFLGDEDSEDFAGSVPADSVPDIVAALEAVDIGSLVAAADFSQFAEAELYPEIWDDDSEELREDLRRAFANVLAFYRTAAEKNYAVIVSIW